MKRKRSFMMESDSFMFFLFFSLDFSLLPCKHKYFHVWKSINPLKGKSDLTSKSFLSFSAREIFLYVDPCILHLLLLVALRETLRSMFITFIQSNLLHTRRAFPSENLRHIFWLAIYRISISLFTIWSNRLWACSAVCLSTQKQFSWTSLSIEKAMRSTNYLETQPTMFNSTSFVVEPSPSNYAFERCG